MIIELKEAAQQALSALEKSQPHPSNPVIGLTNQDFIDHEETIRQLRTAIQQAEAQQVENSTATPEPVWFHKHWCDGDDIFYRPDDNIPSGSTPLYTHPAPSVPEQTIDKICYLATEIRFAKSDDAAQAVIDSIRAMLAAKQKGGA